MNDHQTEKEVIQALKDLSYYQWLRVERTVGCYFQIKKGEHEKTLTLSDDEAMNKAINRQLG